MEIAHLLGKHTGHGNKTQNRRAALDTQTDLEAFSSTAGKAAFTLLSTFSNSKANIMLDFVQKYGNSQTFYGRYGGQTGTNAQYNFVGPYATLSTPNTGGNTPNSGNYNNETVYKLLWTNINMDAIQASDGHQQTWEAYFTAASGNETTLFRF